MKTFVKDPSAVLDYAWDWVDWLGTDTIDTFNFTLPDDLAEDSSSEADGIVTIWVSGGVLNKSYIVTCTITTPIGRTDERSAIFNVKDR